MLKAVCSVVLGLCLSSQLGFSQVTTGTISGVVQDGSGAVIPGAKVTVKNVDTGISRGITTDAQGRYHVPNLLLGNYETQAQSSGFRTELRSGIRLSVGQEAVVNFVLNPGEVAEKITVTGEAPIVNTTNAAISGLVENQAIQDLPLNGRSFDQLITLQEGTALARRAGGGSTDLTGKGTKITISGSRPQQNSFLLDGSNVNDPTGTIPGSAANLFLGVDTIREFRVLTNAYSAEYGHSAGGVITAVTKSGTNELHGSAFEFHRNDDLDARNFFDDERPAFVRNQFGGMLGGPIKRNQTFFLGSYEGLRQRLGQTLIATVPNELARQGIVPVKGQLENIGVAPAVKPWLARWPLPNGRDFGNGTAEHVFGAPSSVREDFFSARGDHAFSSNHSMFGRYTFDDADNKQPNPFPNENTALKTRNQYSTVELASILAPTTINAFRAAYNRSFAIEKTIFDGGFPADLTFVPGVPFTLGGFLAVDGITELGVQRAPRDWAQNLFQWSDDLTHTRGRHTLKTGLDIERFRMNLNSLNGRAGVFSFNSGLTAFLEGKPDRFLTEIPGNETNRGWRETLFGFYAQDDFKMTPHLTLNLGVRWEFVTSPTEVNGRSSNMFDVLKDFRVGNPFFETDKDTIAPRFGFAWNTRGNGKLVVRGGYGLFYDQPFVTNFKGNSNVGPPFGARAELRDNPPFPNAFEVVNLKNPIFGDTRPVKYTGTTYAMQYNLTLQSEIAPGWGVTLGYAGSQGRKLFETGQQNIKFPTILPDGRQCFNTSRGAPNPFCPDGARALRNPKFGVLRIQATDANSHYDALVARVEKRLSGGLRLQGSYTYSKIMSDSESVFGSDFAGGGENAVSDPFNPRLDRAPAGFSLKHNFVFNYGYDLPIVLAGAMGKFLNGWQLGGVVTVTSGAPSPVLSSFGSDNGSTGSSIIERPNLVPGRTNNPTEGVTAGCGGVPAGQKLGTPDLYFDPCNFELGLRGFYGNLGRNTIIGPDLATFDFSLIKITALTERMNLQFRAELFNLFNRANFGTPTREAFDQRGNRIGGTGRITDTSTSSRQIQFGLKLIF